MRKEILKQELKAEKQQADAIQLWEEILKKSIVNDEQLCNLLKDKISRQDIKRVIEKYPMSINPYYLSLIKKENDAIWRQCIPDAREIDDDFGFEDPLHEEKDSPVPGLTHRYPDRVLLLVSNRCAMYCRFSLLPGTKILTEDMTERNIEDVKRGDKILSHKGRPKYVYETFKRRYSKPILEIKTKRNLSIKTTEEHPFLVLKRGEIKCNQGDWQICKPSSNTCEKRHPNRITNFTPKFLYAKNIQIGDFVVTPFFKNEKKIKYTNCNMAYIMGLYLAEGDLPIRKNGDYMGVRFSFGHKEEKLAKNLEQKLKKLSKKKIYLKCYPKKSVYYVRIFDKDMAKLFEKKLGKYSYKKKLSKDLIFNSSDKFKLSLLKGYLDGDGTIYTRKTGYGKACEISFSTASADLAKQIFMILTQLGFMPSLYVSKSEINKPKISAKVRNIIIGRNPRYSVRICHREGWDKWFKIKKSNRYQTSSFNTKEGMFSEVVSIKRKKYKGFAYDSSVKKDESYIANLIAVHNCTRKRKVGMPYKTMTKEDILKGIEYIKEHKEIRDVILSGGDPLLLKDSELEFILKSIREIKHIEIIRIGTRVPCTLPQRITPELCSMLRKYHPLYINTHFNHPSEITAQSKRACEMLADAGIPLGNQAVLLKGVNDSPEIMKKLMQKLLRIRVKPYYIYQADLTKGTNHFRTKVSEGINIIKSLRGFTSGMCVPHFVIDAPGGGGKIPITPNYIVKEEGSSIKLRNYENKEFEYIEPG